MLKWLLFGVLLLPGLGNAEPLRVFVSVIPQQTFVEKVGGEHVAVRAMVRPGQSPATYDPTPEQINALAAAALYIRIGVPFENAWMERIRSANPGLRVVDARDGLELHDSDALAHGHPGTDMHSASESHGDHDPHLWTSPPLVKEMARGIRDLLTEMDPQNGPDYATNFDRFAGELDGLDQEIRARLANLKSRKLMVFHPAWGYFADAYGLTQLPIELEGKEPGARRIAELIDQAKREQIKTVFVQPQFNQRSAQQIASAIGGRVVAIDPLSPDYIANLREVARQIADAGG